MALIQALTKGHTIGGTATEFSGPDITTPEMQKAIARWYGMYYSDTVSEKEDKSLRVPYIVVNKLCKTIFSEYSAELESGEGAKAKNEKLTAVLAALNERKQSAMQQGMIGGECLLKPIPTEDGFDFLVVPRHNYVVLARNMHGGITKVGTAEHTARNGKHYTLLEERECLGDGRLRITNKLYEGKDRGTLGSRVPLDKLPEYEELEEDATLPLPLHSIGLIPLCMPVANCVDGSPDGVAVYAPAASLIEKADNHEHKFNREFDKAESRIIASRDLLRFDGEGNAKFSEDLFIGLDEAPEDIGVTIFNPNIRHESYLARKNDLLRDVENVIGFKRGILSEVEAEERTATEITSSAGDYNLTIQDLQGAWTRTVILALQTCDLLGQMYHGWPAGEYQAPTIDYGDGVLFNRDKAWDEYQTMVSLGWMKPEVALGWYFNMPFAEEDELEAIRQKYMPGFDEKALNEH